MTSTDVTATGNSSDDIKQINNAILSFDEVRLKGTFDFTGFESGMPKRVITIAKNVKISAQAGATPVIIGGEKPFLVSGSASR